VSIPVLASQGPPPSGHKAETYALISVICQAIGGVVFAVLVFFLVDIVVAAYVLAAAIVFPLAGFAFVYRPIQLRQYELAKAPAQILLFISFFLGGIFPCVFYALTSSKLQAAINEQRAAPIGFASVPSGVAGAPLMSPQSPPSPPSLSASAQRPCPFCGTANEAQFSFCKNCGKPLPK